MHRKYWRGVAGAKPPRRANRRAAPGLEALVERRAPPLRGAVLNLKRDPRGYLWGGLVEGLSEEEWMRLDEQERSHLPRTRVMVVTARGRRVWAYCYRQRVRGPERMPATGYLAAVRAGAKALGGAVMRDVEADVARLLARQRRR
jgi:hypothetical protein